MYSEHFSCLSITKSVANAPASAVVAAFTLYFVCLLWVAFAKSFAAELAGRIILGLASGAGECLGALTVTDIFFAHERGVSARS
jgi:uncharacterized membrane protein (DUF485 family)